MKNNDKTREQLLKELEKSNKKIAELEKFKTKRKRTEEALNESENNLRTLFNAMTDIVFEMDYDGRYINIAPTSPELMFKPSEETVGKTLHEIFPKSEADKFLEFIRKCLDENEITTIEYPLIINEKTIWFEGRATPKTENSVLYIASDITKRKLVEEEMQKLAAVVKHSSELVNLSNLDGRMTFLNESGGKMLGIEPHEVENINIMEVIPDHLIGRVEKELLPALMKGGTWEGDLQYCNIKTGKLSDVHAMTFNVNDPDTGEPQFLANVSMDITESKRVEKALRESEEKYRTIFESSPEAIVLFDKKGNVIDVNGRIKDWLGYKPEDIVRKNLAVFPFMSNRSKMMALKKFSLRMSGKKNRPFELEFTDKNGEKRIGFIAASSIKDEKGEIIQNLVMISDITERKKTEAELTKHHERLEELVQERTKELEEKNKKLKHFNELFVGREFRIKDLKNRVKELEEEARRSK